MGYGFVKLSFPIKERLETLVSKVPILEKQTIYDAVDFFRDKVFLKPEIKNKIIKQIDIGEDVELRTVINLHNEDGLDIEKIKFMFEQIKSGQDVLSDCGLPNIKLVKSKNNELILFDGHHTLIAYMLAGRKSLSDVPNMIIKAGKGFSDKEIHVFFGEHSNKLKNKNWKDYVVNWQALEKKQLCKRKRKNIGELFDAIRGCFF